MSHPHLPPNIDSLQWVGPEDPVYADTGLIHCAYIPPEATRAQPAPLVVMLHGWSGDESSMWIFKRTIPAGVAIIAPRAPLLLDNGGFVWFQYAESRFNPKWSLVNAAVTKLEHFLSALPRHYPVDPTKLMLMGFSQGAMMCSTLVFSHPFETIGVASLAGAVLPLRDVEPQDNLLAGLPVFVAHGTRDEVIPIEYARQTRTVYAGFGADVTYGEYPTAHKMHTNAFKDLKQWVSRIFPTG